MEKEIKPLALDRAIIDAIFDFVFLVEAQNHRIIDFNRAVSQKLGYSVEELTSLSLPEITETSAQTLDDYLALATAKEESSFLTNMTLKKKNDTPMPCSVNIFLPVQNQEEPIYAVSFKDIKERLAYEKILFAEKEKIQVTLRAIHDAVITINNKRKIDYMNPAAEELLKCSLSKCIGKPISSVLSLQKENGTALTVNFDNPPGEKKTVLFQEKDLRLVHPNNKTTIVEVNASAMFCRDGKPQGTAVIIRNVTSARRMEQKLLWQATHDSLTGLLNRRQFEEELTQALDISINENMVNIMMYIDLDQFKLVNDIVGHIAGDELLKQLTSVISLNLSDEAILARLGGDEFGVIIKNSSIEKTKPIAEKLIEVIQNFRFQWGNNFYKVGASVGLVPIHRESISMTHVMSMADLACDTAKELGRNRVHVYIGGELDYHKRQGEMKWVARIKEALEKDQFILYRQPIVPINGNTKNRPSHFEVLLRMTAPDGSIIPPDDFLPAANRYNLMKQIDRWVICNTLKTIANTTDTAPPGTPKMIYAINLSGSSLSDESLSLFILDLFQKFKLDPSQICFEVTESEAIRNFNSAKNFMNELRAEGCKFALDDFGAGLSSFGYLKSLPVDILKIDGAFVKDVLNDKIDLAMLEAINQIGHIMNLKTIAEYVESREIYNALLDIGVDYAQGYAICKPEPFSTAAPMGF